MRCVNCQLRIVRLRRHRLSDESAQVVERVQRWVYPRDVTGADFICHSCWELINNNPNEDPQQQLGHRNVCAGCGRSILRIRSRLVLRPEMSEREVLIGNVVSEWIRPRQLTDKDEVCVPCYLRAQRLIDSSHRSSAPVALSISSVGGSVQPTSSQHMEQVVEVIPSTSGDHLLNETSPEQVLPTTQAADTAEFEEAGASITRSPIQETSAEQITLPTIRRTADTARRCLFLECNDSEKRRVPDGLRKQIMKEFNFYIPRNARICNYHLDANLFHELYADENSISTFSASHIEEFVYLLSEDSKLDFLNPENIDDHGVISFHRFPKKPDLKEKWINATGRENWFPTKSSTICSKHFRDSDYDIKKSGYKYLKIGAIPRNKIVCCYSSGLAYLDTNVGAVDMPGTSCQSAVSPKTIQRRLKAAAMKNRIPAEKNDFSAAYHQARNPAQVKSVTDADDMPGTLSDKSSPALVDSEIDAEAEDMPGTSSEKTSLAQVDSETDAEDMPGTLSGITSRDSSSENEIKIFCPKCNTEVSHTAEGIQEDKTKILIAKVYHYFEQEYEELKKMYGDLDLTPLSKFRQRTALATGVSETKLLEILKEEEERNADKRQETPQKGRAARKRRRQTDSSSVEDSSNDNDEDIEQPSYVDEVQTLVVKMESPEYNEEPEIFLPTGVKVELGGGEVDKAQFPMDPISVDVKIEPRDDEVDTTNETLALNEPADSQRKGRKIRRKNDDTSTRQHTPGESSAPAASSSASLTETSDESSLSGERRIKMEEAEIHEEGFS